MQIHIDLTSQTYDGSQLRSLFAYKTYQVQGDSIVVFRGPCQIPMENMVDIADVLAGEHIYSEDMLHFIIEHFDMDLEKAVTRQRLLMTIVKEELEKQGINGVTRNGDDLYALGKKHSISIATLSPVSTVIHAALNISSANTPVPTISLQELGIEKFLVFGRAIAEKYLSEIQDIRDARCKVRGVS